MSSRKTRKMANQVWTVEKLREEKGGTDRIKGHR